MPKDLTEIREPVELSSPLVVADCNDDEFDDNPSPLKRLLSLHEQTIACNFDFMDVLEKEACIRDYEVKKRNMNYLSPVQKGLSPIRNLDSSKDDDKDDSPSGSRSPILCGSLTRIHRRNLRKRSLASTEEECEHSSTNVPEGLRVSDSRVLSQRRRTLKFSSHKHLPTGLVGSGLEESTTEAVVNSSDVKQERLDLCDNSKEDIFSEDEKTPNLPKYQADNPVCHASQEEAEDCRPWDYSVSVLKTPKTEPGNRITEQSLSKQFTPVPPSMSGHSSERSPSLIGISKLFNTTFHKSFQSPNHFLHGLSHIDWDESIHVNKEPSTDLSPKSIPFSERFHQQLLKNNQKLVSISRPCTVTSPNEDTSFFGLSAKVKSLIQNLRGIRDLYDWQKSCLSMPEVLERCNLIYALPTSGGKTLVAEILLLKEILINRKNCLFILPYVSIVQEKVRALSQLAVELDFYVEEYAGGKGSYPPRKRRCKNSVYIATIEKALGLVHCLIMDSRLHEVGLVIVDELHLLGEGTRGATLEAALTKLVFSQEKIQIVGMSATIGNLEEIAAFLNAKTFTEDFRPVELHEYIKCGSTIYKINRNLIGTNDCPLVMERTLLSDYDGQQLQNDPDQIGTLVREVIPDGSCLIFCPSRKNCENVAVLICATLPKSLLQVRHDEKQALYKALIAEGDGAVCQVLQKTLQYGVAYHHSGLTTAERRLLEEAFLASTICVICCTSTLAAGVNLPARRVILRSPYVGTEFIDLSRYKQMVGRAGRTGFGGTGESILLCHFQDSDRVLQLLSSSMTESLSCLAEKECAGMKALIMSSISIAQATCRSDVHNLVRHTLLWVQAEKMGLSVVKLADKCVMELVAEGALSVEIESISTSGENLDVILAPNPNSNSRKGKEDKPFLPIGLLTKLKLSRLGEAAVKGSLSMSVATRLYSDLRHAQEKLVLLNHLHLMYIVTPYNMTEQIKAAHQVYFNVYMNLRPDEIKAANALGVTEAVVCTLVRGKPVRAVSQEVVDRFYLTLILYDLWNGKSVWGVSTKFQVPRGQVHNLLVAASAFASSVLRFSEVLMELWCYKALLVDMTQQLSHCCSAELVPLMELPAVKIGRARQLYNAGFHTLKHVAAADPLQLVRELDHMPRKTAYQIVAAAKLLLMDKAEALREQASDYLDGLGLLV